MAALNSSLVLSGHIYEYRFWQKRLTRKKYQLLYDSVSTTLYVDSNHQLNSRTVSVIINTQFSTALRDEHWVVKRFSKIRLSKFFIVLVFDS